MSDLMNSIKKQIKINTNDKIEEELLLKEKLSQQARKIASVSHLEYQKLEETYRFFCKQIEDLQKKRSEIVNNMLQIEDQIVEKLKKNKAFL